MLLYLCNYYLLIDIIMFSLLIFIVLNISSKFHKIYFNFGEKEDKINFKKYCWLTVKNQSNVIDYFWYIIYIKAFRYYISYLKIYIGRYEIINI